ncbi:MAG: HAD-IG family 5'-nucleotidase [Vicinamibacterales bacterium]
MSAADSRTFDEADTLRQAPPGRGLFCNRTLNLRAIRAIGYDMDYTLIHYNVHKWEQKAYAYLKQKLEELDWPVEGLEYAPELTLRGLIIDTKLGNLVKADRFGYIKRAFHGTRALSFEEQRSAYAKAWVDLAEPRWVFLNTFFSLSEACMYAQLVDRFDEVRFGQVLGYLDLVERVHRALDEAHAEGRLKQEILEHPEPYVELDEEAPLALLDQRESGKRLILITNSEWSYTNRMMSYAYDRFLPKSMSWRELFEVIIVLARKPEFFSGRGPLFEVVNDAGLLAPVVGGLRKGGVYVGGNGTLVEQYFGLSGSEILYVGDHLYTDVRISKDVLRWRTAFVLRELEDELTGLDAVRADQERLERLMAEKEKVERAHSQTRLRIQRMNRQYGPPETMTLAALETRLSLLRSELDRLDGLIAPLAASLSRVFNAAWGLLMRTGSDKSHLARQVERFADIYMSRVSNFLYETPFAYLRAPRGSLPHDELNLRRSVEGA